MSVDVFTLACGALPTARLVGFRGTEALSRPFELELFFTVPLGTDVRGAIGTAATLTASRGEHRDPLCWQGVVVRTRLLHQTAERSLYQATLMPKLWQLRHFARSHVQTAKGQKVKDFTSVALQDGGLHDGVDYRFSIDEGSYPEEEFVCQYRESHLAFVDRWFEREGLYYYFEHPTSEGAVPVMVVVDDHGQHQPLLGDGHVRYFPLAQGDASQIECLRELHVDVHALPATVMVTDYNYANPAAPVTGDHAVTDSGCGLLREYGYRVFDADEATRLAEVKAQSIGCRELVLHAKGNVLGLRVGYTFELDDGPPEYPSKYLAIEVRHAGALSAATAEVAHYTGLQADETYRVEVVAIPADVQFRAPQATPWPRIYGFDNGMIDGAADSKYAQIDEQGRYLVRLHFDASDLPDGSTSTYLRMMQPHGGSVEGWHFPLRKGTEVMVGFQGGDPDRPFIAGVVPNAQRPSVVTSKNHTKNVLRTGGNNHLVVEDLEGKQHVDLWCPIQDTRCYLGDPAPHAFITPPDTPTDPPTFTSVKCAYYLHTDGNAGFDVGGDWWQNVGANYYVDVTGTAKVHYVGTYNFNVDADSTEFYNAKRATTIASGRTDTVNAGGMTQTIKGGWHQDVKGDSDQKIHGTYLHKVDAMATDDFGSWTSTVGKAWDAKIGGGWKMHDTPSVSWIIGDKIELKATEIILDAPNILLKAKSECKIDAPKHLEFEPFQKEFIGLSLAWTAAKGEDTGISWSNTVMKTELMGVKVEQVGIEKAEKACELKDIASKIGNGAIAILSFGLSKIG